MAACHRYETNWSAPNRRLVSVYPAAVLPNYDLIPRWRILMAIDTSGSVPDLFAAEALRCSKKPLQNAEIELISFDTEVYEAQTTALTLRGGGGTRVQAVEDHLQKEHSRYPDLVFVFTDGFTPPPRPAYPERWIWILPPYGSKEAVPKQSRAVVFDEGIDGNESTE